MKPQVGQVLDVGPDASVQFSGACRLLFRVIRVMEKETSQTYDGWAWIEGYQLDRAGIAVERREIFVQLAGLRLVPERPRTPAYRAPNKRVPRQRTAPTTTTSIAGRTR